jgi:hypothetical protein
MSDGFEIQHGFDPLFGLDGFPSGIEPPTGPRLGSEGVRIRPRRPGHEEGGGVLFSVDGTVTLPGGVVAEPEDVVSLRVVVVRCLQRGNRARPQNDKIVPKLVSRRFGRASLFIISGCAISIK